MSEYDANETLAAVTQFQARNELHRHFAPGVIDGPHNRCTAFERFYRLVCYALAVFIVFGLAGACWEVLRDIRWEQVTQLMGRAR